jgi:hypothetical protein
LDLADVSHNSGVVSDGVFDQGLNKFLGILEDGSSFLDSSNVWLNALAVLEVLREFLNNSNHDLDTGNDVTNISLLKVSNSFRDLFFQVSTVGEAFSQTLLESRNELPSSRIPKNLLRP